MHNKKWHSIIALWRTHSFIVEYFLLFFRARSRHSKWNNSTRLTLLPVCMCWRSFFIALCRKQRRSMPSLNWWNNNNGSRKKKENNLLTTYIFFCVHAHFRFCVMFFFFTLFNVRGDLSFFFSFSFHVFFLLLLFYSAGIQGQICNGSSCKA